jgi:hypothetical protein
MSEDIATIGIKADTTDLKRGERALDSFAGQGERTEKRVSGAAQLMSRGMRVAAGAAGVLVGSLGTLASGAFFASAVREAQTFETTMLRIDQVIRATGGVAGRSADQLREQARALALSTLESTEGVLQAQQTLLTFRNVQGDVFDRTIKAAADMSAALGGDLNSATMQLAKALENPTEGLSALSRSGTVFTKAQKEMVKGMVEAGDIASAQAFILSELEAQYGGTAQAAAQGLAGAQDTLAQRMQELKLALSDQLGLLSLAVAANNSLADAVLYVTDNLPAFIQGVQMAGAVVVGLAFTQIPALVLSLATATGGMTAATTGAGLLAGAMRLLGGAVALAGGPLGLLLGIAGGAAAAMLLLRDNTATAAPIMDEAKDAVDRINAVLATSSESALPSAARATLNLTNENIKLAKSAYAAAEAELAKAKAAAQYAQTELGLQQAFSPTGQFTQAESDLASAVGNLTRAQSALLIQQDRLTERINEGQLSLSAASEAMAENQRRAIDLTVTMDDLAGSLSGAGAGAGGGGKSPVAKLADDLKEVGAASMNLNQSLAGVFTDAITGAKSLQEGLQGLLKQMASMFLNQAFMNVLGNIFPSFGKINFGGARAMGGPVASGRTYLVGEQGPELFTPSGSGQIVPNNALGGGSGGGTVVQVINNSGTPARQERSRGPDGRELVRVIVGEELAGGGFDRQMGGRFGVTPERVRR